jgi:hypothetical protein
LDWNVRYDPTLIRVGIVSLGVGYLNLTNDMNAIGAAVTAYVLFVCFVLSPLCFFLPLLLFVFFLPFPFFQ